MQSHIPAARLLYKRNKGAGGLRAYYDAFLAYFPNKNFSLTAAYAEPGDITVFNTRRQHGLSLSRQAGF